MISHSPQTSSGAPRPPAIRSRERPRPIQAASGWTKRADAAKFADDARAVARRLGDRVKHWSTCNEPNVHALFGYGAGSHAPGLTGLANMLAASHHQNLAHGRALQ